jgi:hypothetical protein
MKRLQTTMQRAAGGSNHFIIEREQKALRSFFFPSSSALFPCSMLVIAATNEKYAEHTTVLL